MTSQLDHTFQTTDIFLLGHVMSLRLAIPRRVGTVRSPRSFSLFWARSLLFVILRGDDLGDRRVPREEDGCWRAGLEYKHISDSSCFFGWLSRRAVCVTRAFCTFILALAGLGMVRLVVGASCLDTLGELVWTLGGVCLATLGAWTYIGGQVCCSSSRSSHS